jgi:hypothetical protein
MATTYTLISSVTVGSGGAANIEFTSIPSTYTDLLLRVSVRQGGSQTHYMRFNNDTSTANYKQRRLTGDGTSAGSDSSTNLGYINPIGVNSSGQTANTFGNLDVYIPNYAGSNFKSVSADSVNENNGTDAIVAFTAAIWESTSAITSIKLTPAAPNYVQYSTAYLYGISNA